MRSMSIFLLTLLLGSSLAIQNSIGKATTTSKNDEHNNNKDKRDSSSATSVPTSNTGYRYSGPAHHYLPPTQSTPSPAPSHQHQEEGYKYQAPDVNHASFSALYQHSNPTAALAINAEPSGVEKLPEHAPSYYVPKEEGVAERPGNYYSPSYFVPRPSTIVTQGPIELDNQNGYQYSKPSSSNFAGYQNEVQEHEQNVANHVPSSSVNNNGYHYNNQELFANQEFNKIPSYAKPALQQETTSHVQSTMSHSPDNSYRYKYPASESTQTKDETLSNSYRFPTSHFASTQNKDESYANHKQHYTSFNAAVLPTLKPLFEPANTGVYTSFGYKPEQSPFEAEVSSIGQNNNYAASLLLSKPNGEPTQSSNNFASQTNYPSYSQQQHSAGYEYPAPTQIPTHNPIPTQVPHSLTSFSHNFPPQPASTFDLPHPGPVGTFAAQTTAVPAPTYLPANTQHGTIPTQHYVSGHESLGYYTQPLNKPSEQNSLNYERPSTNLHSVGNYHQPSSSANDLEYLQMQSHSYQLPSYFTMQMEMPAEHRPQRYEPAQSHEGSYQQPSNAHVINSYGAPVHQPHAIYGSPVSVEPTQATPSNTYLPPSGQFQPPYYIK